MNLHTCKLSDLNETRRYSINIHANQISISIITRIRVDITSSLLSDNIL